MTSKEKKQRVTFTATKIVSKAVTVHFHTKDGKEVVFKGHKDIPKPVWVSFLSKKK